LVLEKLKTIARSYGFDIDKLIYPQK